MAGKYEKVLAASRLQRQQKKEKGASLGNILSLIGTVVGTKFGGPVGASIGSGLGKAVGGFVGGDKEAMVEGAGTAAGGVMKAKAKAGALKSLMTGLEGAQSLAAANALVKQSKVDISKLDDENRNKIMALIGRLQ
tara:strand:- start:2321 stop:2728 length:408 start_codon:yes stop_codon:yes gene_type:complete